jgi:hypothetical protein
LGEQHGLLLMATMVAVVALVALPSLALAQEPRVYLGGAISLVVQTHSSAEPLGGATLGGSALVGVQISRRVAVEFEPSFGAPYSWEYTYRPSPSLTARVVASRRDTFFPVQARIRLGVLEPVVGVGFVHGRLSRHATIVTTIGSTPYFDDSRSEDDLAFVAGVDAALELASRFYLVPTFRVLISPGASPHPLRDPLGANTSTGSFVFRYGVGARVAF